MKTAALLQWARSGIRSSGSVATIQTFISAPQADGMCRMRRHLLRALGHVPIPGVRRVVWRLWGALDQSGPADFEVRFAGLRYHGRLDDFIDWNVFFFGSYSPQELDFLRTSARIMGGVGNTATYCDIGANVGHHALFMSQRVRQVVAFEPSRYAYERFNENIRLNQLSNVRIFPIALGDRDEAGQLGSGFDGNSGSRSLKWTLDQDKMETVVVRRGDDFFSQEDLPKIDLLKLDVEGYEKDVLIGLHQTLLRDRPIILMELIGNSEKSGFRDQIELRNCLYPEHELFSLSGRRRAKLTSFDWSDEEVVCLPREHVSKFRHIISEK